MGALRGALERGPLISEKMPAWSRGNGRVRFCQPERKAKRPGGKEPEPWGQAANS